jgi:hypothetical protein
LVKIFLNGKLIFNDFLTKYCEEIRTANSELIHTIADPTLCKCLTNRIFNSNPTLAPIIEFINISLSFCRGISNWITNICSIPIININGITIRIGRMAPSNPDPAIIRIIWGANMVDMIIIGMQNARSASYDIVVSRFISSIFPSKTSELILGNITAVNAVKIDKNTEYNLVEVV